MISSWIQHNQIKASSANPKLDLMQDVEKEILELPLLITKKIKRAAIRFSFSLTSVDKEC